MKIVKLDRQIIRQTMRGYAEVNRITEQERYMRLKQMTDNVARRIFEGLSSGVHELTDKERERLMPLRMAHHRKMRQAMKRLVIKIAPLDHP